MNIIEAVNKAAEGYAILCVDRNEWIICSGGQLRWKTNRQPVMLGVKDIMSNKWISEDELLTISEVQLNEALNFLVMETEGDVIVIKEKSKFFDYLKNCSHTNKARHKIDET